MATIQTNRDARGQAAPTASPPVEVFEGSQGVAISVRAYHPTDEPVVLWLQRNGRLHGDPQRDGGHFPGYRARSEPAGRHQLLVVEADGHVAGATAIVWHHGPVAHLRWLCIAPNWQSEPLVAERLVNAATADAREQGCLKLVVHTGLAAPQVAEFFESLGFAFSRERWFDGAHVLEFYLNLYTRPELHRQRP